MTAQRKFEPPPGGDVKAMAKACLDRELDGRSYCPVKREDAEKAVAEYRPAYIQTTDGQDQWAGCAVTWANGAMLGTSLDPQRPMSGLRETLLWVQTWKPEPQFREWMAHVVKSLKPINAMAQLDQELMMQYWNLRKEDVHA